MQKVTLLNHQKIKKIKINKLKSSVLKALEILNINKKITVVLVDNRWIRSLNKKFMNKNIPTDVLAFPYYDKNYLGDIVISVEEAMKNSSKFNTSLFEELLLYIIHGILHLKGYRDKTSSQRKVMYKKQEEILRKCLS